MGVIVADQGAGVGGAVVRNGRCPVGGHNIDIKVDEPLPRNVPRLRAHAVRCMADRAGEAIVDVPGVLAEARIPHDLVQVVALGAHCVGAAASATQGAQFRRGEKVGNKSARQRRLAEFVPALEDVGED